VQVPCDEGVAIHIGPESRAVVREGLSEALTGERIGQPLSRENFLFWVPTPCGSWKARRLGASSRAFGRPGVVRDPGMCRHSLRGNREISRSTVWQQPLVRIGKARSRSPTLARRALMSWVKFPILGAFFDGAERVERRRAAVLVADVAG
jgi:hypothetical protein